MRQCRPRFRSAESAPPIDIGRIAMRVQKSLFVSIAFLLAFSASTAAQDLPTAKPADVGLSAERLERITQWLRDDSARCTIRGGVVMGVRNGKGAHCESSGVLDPET